MHAYLDHAATSSLVPEALTAMTEELGQLGNPSSLHNAGRRARRLERCLHRVHICRRLHVLELR